MGNLLGKKEPKSRITEQDKAILGLKQQRDKLNQHKKRIELNLDKERQVAKELLNQNKKEKARTLLKKKRYQENLLAQCDGQLDSIQQMIDNLEFAQIEIKVVENLKLGNESLKKLNSLMSLEEVEKIMDETREAVEYQAEVDSLLSGAGLTQEDEEAVQAEMDALTEQQLPEVPDTHIQLPQPPEQETQLPDVPEAEPGSEHRKRPERKKEIPLLASWINYQITAHVTEKDDQNSKTQKANMWYFFYYDFMYIVLGTNA